MHNLLILTGMHSKLCEPRTSSYSVCIENTSFLYTLGFLTHMHNKKHNFNILTEIECKNKTIRGGRTVCRRTFDGM